MFVLMAVSLVVMSRCRYIKSLHTKLEINLFDFYFAMILLGTINTQTDTRRHWELGLHHPIRVCSIRIVS